MNGLSFDMPTPHGDILAARRPFFARMLLSLEDFMAVSLRSFFSFCLTVIVSMFALAQSPTATYAAPRVTEFKLDNGMQVVVIPDTRSPVVTLPMCGIWTRYFPRPLA